MRASATSEKLNHFGILNIEKIVRSVLTGFILRKLLFFLLLFDHINKDIIFIVMLSNGKLDLSYFFLAGPKTVWICCTYQWPKSPRKIICHEFWRNVFVYLQTHLLTQAIATANKQLLSVVM